MRGFMKKTNIFLLIFILIYFTINIYAQETVSKSGHTGSVASVAFSPDGKLIVSCSFENGTIIIWDVATGQEIRTLFADSKGVGSVRFSPDGTYIISRSDDLPGTINIWDRNTGKELKRISGSASEAIISMDISSDGRQITYVYHKYTSPFQEDIYGIRLFDITTGKQIQSFLENIERATSIAFSPDGTRIITCSFDDRIIKIWDAATGQELRTISEDLDSVDFISFTPDGKYIVSRSRPKQTFSTTIIIWDANTGMKIRGISAEYFCPIAIHPDGSQIATVPYRRNKIRLIDVTTGKDIKTASEFTGHTDEIKSLAFSPDGKLIVSGSSDKSIKLWDAATGKEIRTMGK